MPHLIQKKADGSVDKQWEVRDTPLTVGRGENADAQIDDQEISREHFVIIPQSMAHKIRDLGSRNGTWLNGEKITEHELKSNDLIRAGQTTFFFVIEKGKGLKTVIGELEEESEKSGKGYSTMRRELYEQAGGK